MPTPQPKENPAEGPPPDTSPEVDPTDTSEYAAQWAAKYAVPPLTPEESAKREAAREEKEQQRAEKECIGRWRGLVRVHGKKYENCYFANYHQYDDSQKAVVKELESYAANVEERVAAGRNLILWGPSETGKDHLLMALARQTIKAGYHVHWECGLEIYAQMRQDIADNKSDSMVIRALKDIQILWISDPTSVDESELKTFRGDSLYRLIDYRRNHMLPTWISMNAETMVDAEDMIGPQTMNRLTLDGLELHCNWERFKDQRK